MKDLVVVASAVVAFAVLVTAHLAIVAGLARRSPRWRALAGLVAVPLAPILALRERMRVRAWTWIVAAAVYATSLVMAWR